MKNYIFTVALLCGIVASGCSSKQTAALVESATPFCTNSITGKDNFPSAFRTLDREAVGVANVDGSFEPFMYLDKPPRGASRTPVFFMLSTNNTFKVYRGTNHVAAENKFLGEFKMDGTPVLIEFGISTNHQLFVFATADTAGLNRIGIKRISSKESATSGKAGGLR